MSKAVFYANVETPTPAEGWRMLANEERVARVREKLRTEPAIGEVIEVMEAKADGQVIVRLLEPLAPDRRGMLLLDLEEYLKESLDQGLVIWLEPLGDKSSLRNMRGIEVKS